MAEINSTMIYLIYCKNFCKCHNAPQHNNKKEKNKIGERSSVLLLHSSVAMANDIVLKVSK
jgi:hypothetical protein